MNKKYVKYVGLILCLASANQSFSMDSNKLMTCGAGALIISGVGYTGIRTFYALVDSREALTYEDVSDETQKWARNELRESGIENADTVPLKKAKGNKGWAASTGFVTVPSNFDPIDLSKDKKLVAVHNLKHEMKHFNNYDHTKIGAFTWATTFLGVALTYEQPLLIPVTMPLWCGINIAYIRYQEEGAERFACENARTKDELVATKSYFRTSAELFEFAMLPKDRVTPNYTSYAGNSVIKKKLLSGISQQLGDINSQIDNAKTSNISPEVKALQNKETALYEKAYFIFDFQHPNMRYHEAMAQDHIDKWDEKYRKKLSAADLKFNKAV